MQAWSSRLMTISARDLQWPRCMVAETAKLRRAHPVNAAAPTRVVASGARATRTTLAVRTTGVAIACSHPRRRGSGSSRAPASAASVRHGTDVDPGWPKAATSVSAIAARPPGALTLLVGRPGDVFVEAGRRQIGIELRQPALDFPT